MVPTKASTNGFLHYQSINLSNSLSINLLLKRNSPKLKETRGAAAEGQEELLMFEIWSDYSERLLLWM